MMLNYYKSLIREAIGKEIIKSSEQNGNLYFQLKPLSVLRCMSILSSDSSLEFSTLSDCFAVDFMEKGISLYYQMLSYKLNFHVFIIAAVPKNNIMQSVTILFENANWLEREIFDMFGIQFNDHPDMRRILNNHDHSSFPMLKL